MNAIESLGCVVKDTRIRLGYTQNQLAEIIGVEVRTIMHIENGIANPTWEVVFPLIRALEIDPRTIFYPELNREDEAMAHIQILLLLYICPMFVAASHRRGTSHCPSCTM